MNTLKIWLEKFEAYIIRHPSTDASHDISHFRRVWKLAGDLSSPEDDQLVILAACYFHDIVSHPKNHPLRSQSSKDAAVKTRSILADMNFPEDKLDHVGHCIEAHSFSANIEPETTEAMVVQDADRMESLGAIGLARTFYTAGRINSKMFSSEDPFAENRELDDKNFAVDHFKAKLLKLPQTMKTSSGKEEAIRRAKVLENFLVDLKSEL
jgi:uncharacterized protein